MDTEREREKERAVGRQRDSNTQGIHILFEENYVNSYLSNGNETVFTDRQSPTVIKMTIFAVFPPIHTFLLPNTFTHALHI